MDEKKSGSVMDRFFVSIKTDLLPRAYLFL